MEHKNPNPHSDKKCTNESTLYHSQTYKKRVCAVDTKTISLQSVSIENNFV
jgi:hypothetical protein